MLREAFRGDSHFAWGSIVLRIWALVSTMSSDMQYAASSPAANRGQHYSSIVFGHLTLHSWLTVSIP